LADGRLAVAASADFPDLRPDWPPLREALAELGIAASTQVWTDPDVRWDEFDLVLANGAWDNIHRPEEFLAWVGRVAEVTTMANSPDVLRWNLDKRYLAALSDAGVATVPTTWLTPGSDSDANSEPDQPALPALPLPPGEFVVKPTISGGGFETARYRSGDGQTAHNARAHITRLLDAGRTVMVQPYQSAVDTQGEAGLIFLGGRYSHAIGKGPLLRVDAGPQSHLYQHEQIGALSPSGSQLEAAHLALAAAEHLLGPTTYARVDLVHLADGTPAVLEFELLDPALFFETEPTAAARFAQVLCDLIP
jgi:O-ureido-D-serine cyclo-ligase